MQKNIKLISKIKSGQLAAALALLVLGAACSPHPDQLSADPADGIVRGHRANRKTELSRSVVALVTESEKGQALCTGTLIEKDLVLTAAHCVEGNPDRLVVVFGSQVKSAKQENMREVVAYVQHPRWHQPTEAGRGDLALVRFAGDLPDGFAPAQLATSEVDLKVGTEVRLLGYGVTNGSTHAGAGVLRETATTIVEKHSKTELVLDGTKTSVCFGDSGGPAFVKDGDAFVQWGIASSVTSSECNEASIHTNVVPYRRWIKSAGSNLRQSDK